MRIPALALLTGLLVLAGVPGEAGAKIKKPLVPLAVEWTIAPKFADTTALQLALPGRVAFADLYPHKLFRIDGDVVSAKGETVAQAGTLFVVTSDAKTYCEAVRIPHHEKIVCLVDGDGDGVADAYFKHYALTEFTQSVFDSTSDPLAEKLVLSEVENPRAKVDFEVYLTSINVQKTGKHPQSSYRFCIFANVTNVWGGSMQSPNCGKIFSWEYGAPKSLLVYGHRLEFDRVADGTTYFHVTPPKGVYRYNLDGA